MRKTVVPDLRAEAARQQINWYEIAGAIAMSPGKLGRMMAEREPMPPQVADRIRQVLSSMRNARLVESR